MDYEYYGLSEEAFSSLITARSKYIIDYWRKGRHYSKHISKDPGLASRIADKAVYDNLLTAFYGGLPMIDRPQGVFYGYGHNSFTSIHLNRKYLLKLDFKSCYRNISFDLFWDIMERKKDKLAFPLPKEMVQSIYFPNNYLQAGLVASNIMCDIVFKYVIDKPINEIIWKTGREEAIYSRYYDDLYISADDKSVLSVVRAKVKQLATEADLPLNYKKCYLGILSGSTILGSTVVDGQIRIQRKHKNNLRAAMYELDNMDKSNINYEHKLRSVVSRLANICQNENSPNNKYASAYQCYRDELRQLMEF